CATAWALPTARALRNGTGTAKRAMLCSIGRTLPTGRCTAGPAVHCPTDPAQRAQTERAAAHGFRATAQARLAPARRPQVQRVRVRRVRVRRAQARRAQARRFPPDGPRPGLQPGHKFGQRAHGHAGGAFDQVVAVFVAGAGAGDVQVSPAGVFDELADDEAAGDGAGLPAAGVLDVRDVALVLLLVLGV